MGQYFKVVNLDKKQYLRPHTLGDGAKLDELHHTLKALAALLADGGSTTQGSWAGDRIVIIGDYAAPGGYGAADDNLYYAADSSEDPSWSDISEAFRLLPRR